MLHASGIGAYEHRAQVIPNHCQHGRAAGLADGVGVAETLRPVVALDSRRDHGKVPHLPVRRIGEHGRQGDLVELCMDG